MIDELWNREAEGVDLEGRTDDACPFCGAPSDGYSDLSFTSYNRGCGIEVTKHCAECDTDYVLVYHLGEAVRI